MTEGADIATDLRAALLEALRAGLPLVARPFAALGRELGADEAEVLAAARELRADRSLKSLGGFFDPARLGYAGILAAASVPEEAVEEATERLAEQAAITHVFEREDRYNLWCVTAAESEPRALALLDGALANAGVDEAIVLPAERVMKLTVDFASEPAAITPADDSRTAAATLAREERALARLLLTDVPVTERPFRELAATLAECGYDLDEDRVLETVQELAAAHLLTRIAGVNVTHRAMRPVTVFATWPLSEGGCHLTAACAALTAEPSVTHCYLVPTALVTRPTVATLLHAASRADAEATIARLRAILGLEAPRITYGVREAKRAPLRYFAEGEA